MLLHRVRRPRSFTNLKAARHTSQKAYQALAFLQDENLWNATLAPLFQSASELRELSVVLIVFCHITN